MTGKVAVRVGNRFAALQHQWRERRILRRHPPNRPHLAGCASLPFSGLFGRRLAEAIWVTAGPFMNVHHFSHTLGRIATFAGRNVEELGSPC